MNLRQVVFWLVASVCVASTSLTLAQQVQIKGPKNATEQFSGTTYGPITSSDTLWRIANRYRQNKNLSVYQVMQAIYELNPDAFEDQNFNHLKDGAILNLPSERYVARIDAGIAKQRAERDDANWNPATGSVIKPIVEEAPPEEIVSKDDLSETKEVLEQRLSALDQEQTRQFAAIRQQFADSINSVQSLLDDNQKLYERLSVVDDQIDGLRVRVDEELQLQMDQMLTLQNELLAISREAEAQRKAEMEASSMDWLTDPVTLTLIASGVITLSALTGFAIWMRRRKQQPVAEEIPPLTPGTVAPVTESSAQLDDLSDALSDELSGGAVEEATDDDLFGEDDLLDDVLSEELQESLDEALEEELESFDDLDDEMLVPETDGEEDEAAVDDLFEDGEAVLEQGDLDNLFDEDDLLTDIGDDVDAIDLSDTEEEVAEELSAADAELDALLDDDDLTDAIEQETQSIDEDDAPEPEEDIADIQLDEDEVPSEPAAPSVDDEDEKPEIDIDELLEQPQPELPESLDIEAGDEVSEEMLQQLDKEIASQNEELDNITDDLLNEIEQLEMMEGMLPDDEPLEEDVQSDDAEQQHSIQELDSLSEEIDDDTELDEQDALADDLLAELTDEQGAEPESDPQDDLADELLAELGVEEDIPDDAAEEISEANDVSEDVEEEDAVEASVDDLLEAYQENAGVEDDDSIEALTESEESGDSAQIDESDIPEQPDVSDDDEAEHVESDIEEEAAVPSADEIESDAQTSPDDEPTDAEEVSGDLDEGAETVDEMLEELDAAPSEDEEIEPVDIDLDEVLDAEADAEPAIETAADTLDESLDDSADSLEEPIPDELSDDLLDEPEPGEDDDSAVELPEQESFAEPLVEEAIEAELEDEFDKALDDFDEDDGLDEFPDSVSEEAQETVSTEDAPPLSLDDVPSFGEDLDGFTETHAEPSEQVETPNSDATAEQNDQDAPETRPVSDELDDVPGLGDWLGGDEGAPETDSALEEIEAADFDELLESIDQEPETASPVTDELLDNPDLDLEALLTEDDSVDDIDMELAESEQPLASEDDFLDVDALLNESVDAESEPMAEQDLDLDVSLEAFTGVADDEDVVDVDGDKGVGAQLDLARAYIEIDDTESAVEVLEGIISKGDEAQQEEARAILEKLKS